MDRTVEGDVVIDKGSIVFVQNPGQLVSPGVVDPTVDFSRNVIARCDRDVGQSNRSVRRHDDVSARTRQTFLAIAIHVGDDVLDGRGAGKSAPGGGRNVGQEGQQRVGTCDLVEGSPWGTRDQEVFAEDEGDFRVVDPAMGRERFGRLPR